MRRVILHSDLNCFYAAVEMNEDPLLRGRKVAVCGSVENRHGIVLTASYPAKREGVRTGMANWQALQVCPDLIIVPPRYDLYLKYSRMVRRIYLRWSDAVESFGMDECWINLPFTEDVTGEGVRTAETIRRAVREETGLTVSVGVSFSKVFAKLGSDMKKPDAVTVITPENYEDRIWPLPVKELLYVGPATSRKLLTKGVRTIGDLARTDPRLIRAWLGKNGLMLREFANGTERADVMPAGWESPVKSVGHGVTCVRDLTCNYEVWRVLYELSQDVGHRLLNHELGARGVELTVRDADLRFYQFQTALSFSTQSPLEMAAACFDLFRLRYEWTRPVRALTLRAILLHGEENPEQLDLFGKVLRRAKQKRLDTVVDDIRRRFGTETIRAASLMGKLHMAEDRCETVPMPPPMYR